MGTGPFAVPMFRALLRSKHDVTTLVTRPIADAGRRKTAANPMRDAAEAAGLEVWAPANVNDSDSVAALRQKNGDLFVVCDYGQILSAECLAAARLGGINLHASLLPKYRGAAPIHWAILNGDRATGVSVIHMTPRLDGGPILKSIETLIGPDETTEQLEERLAKLGVDAVLESIEVLEHWDGVSEIGRPQDSAAATRAPRLKKDQGLIDWSLPAKQIRNQIRAFNPWPGSFTYVPRAVREPDRLIVHAAEVEFEAPSGNPGTVIDVDANRLIIACGQNALSLRIVQPAGKRSLPIAKFLRGYQIPLGTTLG